MVLHRHASGCVLIGDPLEKGRRLMVLSKMYVGLWPRKNIKNIFLILFLALSVIGFVIGGHQGLIVTVMVLLFAVGSYLAFLMSSKMSGSEADYFSFNRMLSFLEYSWGALQRAELSEAMPAVPINDFIRVDYKLFCSFP